MTESTEETKRQPGTPDGDVSVLSLEVIPVFGSTLFGTHWQADLARMISLSKSQITRILKKRDPNSNPVTVRNLSPNFPVALKEVVLQRILDLAILLDTPGMPYADSETMDVSLDLVVAAARLLRGELPIDDKDLQKAHQLLAKASSKHIKQLNAHDED